MFLPKLTKLRKLVTRATGHGFDMQRYKRVASGGRKLGVVLHVANDGHRWRKERKGRKGRRVGQGLLVAGGALTMQGMPERRMG